MVRSRNATGFLVVWPETGIAEVRMGVVCFALSSLTVSSAWNDNYKEVNFRIALSYSQS